ncbi:MAG: alpha/beta fold hydrolase [Chloroflexia bacterium]|nr:alpha/beta fold hydrolase [Chloroflexia bacterium]
MDERYQSFALTGELHAEVGAFLLHGFTGTPAEMRPLGTALREQGIDAHGILLPGMGAHLDRLNTMTADTWLAAAHDAWREHTARYRRSILIGYSMGGALALHLAARRPPDLLVLLAPFTRMADRRAVALPVLKHVIRSYRPFEKIDFEHDDTRTFFARTMPELDLDHPEVRRSLTDGAAISTAVLDELRWLGRQAERDAAKVTTDTIIVQGDADGIVQPRYTRQLVSRMGGLVTYHEVHADHMLPFDGWPSWPTVRDLVTAATCRFAAAGAARSEE